MLVTEYVLNMPDHYLVVTLAVTIMLDSYNSLCVKIILRLNSVCDYGYTDQKTFRCQVLLLNINRQLITNYSSNNYHNGD